MSARALSQGHAAVPQVEGDERLLDMVENGVFLLTRLPSNPPLLFRSSIASHSTLAYARLGLAPPGRLRRACRGEQLMAVGHEEVPRVPLGMG